MKAENKLLGIPAALPAGLLLVLMAVLAGGAALRESVTVDEVSHIGAGVSYLQKLDLRLNPEHPPLPKVLSALPLVIRGVHADYNHICWTFSDKFFQAFLGQWVFGEWLLEKWNDPKSSLAWARLPMLLLMLALGWTIFSFAKQLGGPWGGLLCLSAFVTTPAFIAFGPLVHTDIAVALFSLLTLWTFAEVWRVPNRKNMLLFSLSLAAALLSKFTAGILFFVFLAFVLSRRLRPLSGRPPEKSEAREWRRQRWRATLKGVLCAALVVYLFYFLFSWRQPTDVLSKIGSGTIALTARRLLLPPLLYLGGVFWVLIGSKRPTFILGNSYPHGVWFYFPVVFALKSSLGFLGLLLTALAAALSRWSQSKVHHSPAIPEQFAAHWRVLWVGLLVFTAMCILSPLDISIRHFSVPLVLLILLLAPVPRMLSELSRAWAAKGSAVLAVLVAACLFTAVRTYPYFFPYMNALSFGHPAYALVNDSNVDWNQSLPEAQRFVETHQLQKIGLDQYGFSDPTVSIPRSHNWNCQNPSQEDAGQWVLLSANFILDGHNCAWLLQYPHESMAAGSMYAVHLPSPIPAAGSTGGPPLPSAYREFGGAPFDIRSMFMHLNDRPEDLPRASTWMQTAFQNYNSAKPAPPPKPPWEQ